MDSIAHLFDWREQPRCLALRNVLADPVLVDQALATYRTSHRAYGSLALVLLKAPSSPSVDAHRAAITDACINQDDGLGTLELTLFPNLRVLRLTSCTVEPLDHPALQELSFVDVTLPQGLGTVGPLVRCELLRTPVERLPVTKKLILDWSGDTLKVPAGVIYLSIRAAPALCALTVPEGCTRVEGWNMPKLRTVVLPDSLRILRLEDVGLRELTLPRLDCLHLRAKRLTALVSGPQTLNEVALSVAVPELDLSDWSCPRVELRAASSKRVVLPADCVAADLMRCSTLRELVPGEALRGVMLAGSGLTRREIPMDWRWCCTWDAKARIGAMPHRVKPLPKTKVATGHRTPLARIRALLGSRDRESVDQAIELLMALERPDWWDALLDGTRYEAVRTGAKPGLTEPSRLRSPSIRGCLSTYALTGLLATAPPEAVRAIALRDEVVRLDEVGRGGEASRRFIHARYLAGLPKLRVLVVTKATLVADPAALPLNTLQVSECRGDAASPGWLNAPALRRLYVRDGYGRAVDLKGLKLPELRRLVTSTLQVDHSDALLACPKLADATFFWARSDLRWADRHPGLTKLSVDYGLDPGLRPERACKVLRRTPRTLV